MFLCQLTCPKEEVILEISKQKSSGSFLPDLLCMFNGLNFTWLRYTLKHKIGIFGQIIFYKHLIILTAITKLTLEVTLAAQIKNWKLHRYNESLTQ